MYMLLCRHMVSFLLKIHLGKKKELYLGVGLLSVTVFFFLVVKNVLVGIYFLSFFFGISFLKKNYLLIYFGHARS